MFGTAALRQEQSFNNDHKALIGNRPSGPCIIARMEPMALAKSADFAPGTLHSALVTMEASRDLRSGSETVAGERP
ncbi:MAG: hypothetical protein JWP25_314 [Bradyrhizobium sp.]|nr:hypothetical protein [Bradyrhizobium sp.]